MAFDKELALYNRVNDCADHYCHLYPPRKLQKASDRICENFFRCHSDCKLVTEKRRY